MAYSSRTLESMIAEQKPGGRRAYTSNYKTEAEHILGTAVRVIGNLKVWPHKHVAKPHLLVLPKQFHTGGQVFRDKPMRAILV